ncbi:MAG: hypothetical protein QNJ47_15705 [Nostocaceae cyanobacterium]|nr:hypothetical protein [Nostocaceae cyanobacterium]
MNPGVPDVALQRLEQGFWNYTTLFSYMDSATPLFLFPQSDKTGLGRAGMEIRTGRDAHPTTVCLEKM